MVYIHGGFLVFGSKGADESGDSPDVVNWMKARPSGQLAAGKLESANRLNKQSGQMGSAGWPLAGQSVTNALATLGCDLSNRAIQPGGGSKAKQN